MRGKTIRLGAPLILGVLLVGTLVLIARAGDAPVGAAPVTRGPGTPLLGETLQRAALAPTQPVTSTYYFPLIFHQWFEPIDYYEPFNWPPVSGWQYGSVRNVVTVHEEFIYGQKQETTENPPSNVYFVAIRDDFDHVFLTSPRTVFGMGDFTYTAWLRRMSESTDQLYEYGILISPVYIDAAHPKAEDVYTFQMRLGYGGQWIIKKWDIDNLGSRTGNEEDYPDGKSGKILEAARWWNIFQIERKGDVLYFRIANQNDPSSFTQVATVTDHNLSFQYFVGFYAAHPGVTSWKEYQFDNVRIVAEP